MSITLVTDPGASNANSYGSLAEADAYFSAHPNGSPWTSANDAEKRKAALLAGARRIDLEEYDGERSGSDQALAWPRSGVEVDGITVASTVVPNLIKWAQFEEALAFLQKPARGSASGLAAFKSVSVGPIAVTPADSGPAPGDLAPAAAMYLRKLGCYGAGQFRVFRG